MGLKTHVLAATFANLCYTYSNVAVRGSETHDYSPNVPHKKKKNW